VMWQVKTPQPLVGGTLATAGGLVFTGEPNGWFRAYDAASGAVLWSIDTGARVGAPPMSYVVNGRQFIAVSTGLSPAEVSGRPGGAIRAFAPPATRRSRSRQLTSLTTRWHSSREGHYAPKVAPSPVRRLVRNAALREHGICPSARAARVNPRRKR
jgi:outer membrane protein assembly factor BamB